MNYILVEEASREARCTCIAEQPPVTLKFFPIFIFHRLHSTDFTKTICVAIPWKRKQEYTDVKL